MEHIRIIATSECKVLHLAFIHTHIYKSLTFYIPCFITLNNYSMYCYSQVQKMFLQNKNKQKNCHWYGEKGVKDGHLLAQRKVGMQDLDMLLFSCPPFLSLLSLFKSAPFKLLLKKQTFQSSTTRQGFVHVTPDPFWRLTSMCFLAVWCDSICFSWCSQSQMNRSAVCLLREDFMYSTMMMQDFGNHTSEE